MSNTPSLFPLDPTGTNPINAVTETYSITQLTGNNYFQFKFKNGPSFDNLVLKHVPTNRVLVPNVDYQLSYLFKVGTNHFAKASHNKKLYSACVILNKKLSGTISATMHYLGGDFSELNSNWIPEAVSGTPGNKQVLLDNIINVPVVFPPVTHKVSSSALTSGFDDVVTALWAINKSILSLSPVGKFDIEDIIGLETELKHKYDDRGPTKVLCAAKSATTGTALEAQIQLQLPKPYNAKELIALTLSVSTEYESYRLHVSGTIEKNKHHPQVWGDVIATIEGTNTVYKLYCTYNDLGFPIIYISKSLIGDTLVSLLNYQTTSTKPELMVDDFYISFTDNDLRGYVESPYRKDNQHVHQDILDSISKLKHDLGLNDPFSQYWHNDETASRAQAEAGNSNGVIMTALRVHQHYLHWLTSSFGSSRILSASQYLVSQVKTALDNLKSAHDPFTQYFRKDKTASNAQAVAGSDNSVVMTALRSMEQLKSRISSSLSGSRKDYSASEWAVKQVNDSLGGHLRANDPHTQYFRKDKTASNAQAVAGSDNSVVMTALRSMEQLKSRISSSLSGSRKDYSASEWAVKQVNDSLGSHLRANDPHTQYFKKDHISQSGTQTRRDHVFSEYRIMGLLRAIYDKITETKNEMDRIGYPIANPTNILPDNRYMWMEGQTFDPATFPELAKVYKATSHVDWNEGGGAGNVVRAHRIPDMRRLAIVGASGVGLPGQGLLQFEPDKLKNHGHQTSDDPNLTTDRSHTGYGGEHRHLVVAGGGGTQNRRSHNESLASASNHDWGASEAQLGSVNKEPGWGRTSISGEHRHYIHVIQEGQGPENTIKNRKFRWMCRVK